MNWKDATIVTLADTVVFVAFINVISHLTHTIYKSSTSIIVAL